MPSDTHLGIKYIGSPESKRLSIDNYIPLDKNGKVVLSFNDNCPIEELPAKKVSDVYLNFLLNLNFCNQLDDEEFKAELNSIITVFPSFREITDIHNLGSVSGVYIMVLGKYKQIYVGVASNVQRRVKAHWDKKLGFDRSLWGGVYSSILSIDSYKILDTTALYVLEKSVDEQYGIEKQVVEMISPCFLTNRTVGGIHEPSTDDKEYTAMMSRALAIAGYKTRTDLIPTKENILFRNLNKEQRLLVLNDDSRIRRFAAAVGYGLDKLENDSDEFVRDEVRRRKTSQQVD